MRFKSLTKSRSMAEQLHQAHAGGPAGGRGGPAFEFSDVVKTYRSAHQGSSSYEVRAVDGVSFSLEWGEVLGILGESGSGKSTVARMMIGLETPTAGVVRFDGAPTSSSAKDLKRLRRRVQMVFQDPVASLNRRRTIAQIVSAPLKTNGVSSGRDLRAKVARSLEIVGLAEAYGNRFPSELSGGQCQRVAIARALVLEPEVLVLDEAVSALDVSIRAQILNLINGIRAALGVTCVFISHDLAVVKYMSTHVIVMSAGRIVESGDSSTLFRRPRDAYTRALMDAVPVAPIHHRGGLGH
jgi:peptide/nickel transport system ATP-binding protein